MKILSEVQVQKEIRKVLEENPEALSLNLKQEAEASDIFYELMKEQVNKNKDLELQKSMVSDIVTGLSRKETRTDLFKRYGDNRHLEYFDNVLEKGASREILEALNRNYIPSEVLKGIRRDTPYNEYVKGYKGVKVIQEIEKPEGTSPFVVYFAIEKDGKIIYEWKPNGILVDIYDDLEEDIPYEDNMENKIRVPKQDIKKGQQTIKRVSENTAYGNRKIDFYYTKKGNLCRRITENGKFVGGGLVK